MSCSVHTLRARSSDRVSRIFCKSRSSHALVHQDGRAVSDAGLEQIAENEAWSNCLVWGLNAGPGSHLQKKYYFYFDYHLWLPRLNLLPLTTVALFEVLMHDLTWVKRAVVVLLTATSTKTSTTLFEAWMQQDHRHTCTFCIEAELPWASTMNKRHWPHYCLAPPRVQVWLSSPSFYGGRWW